MLGFRRKKMTKNESAPIHIAVVLDRSGSMASIASDIVGGFNHYLREQQQREGPARMTLVQFDDRDPFEVLIDGRNLQDVAELTPGSYQPRGNTPLLDAVGRMILRVDADITARAGKGLPAEDQVVVVVTDGLENASREFTRPGLFELIEHRRHAGWVFVFLGADQDAYEEGTGLGVAGANAAPWFKTKAGAAAMYDKLSRQTTIHRGKAAAMRKMDADRFYEKEPGEK
jgi:Mg-chelatase subunit ChlD